MPIYEYRCGACNHEMELLQKITEEPLLKCPACGQEQLRKLISVAAFRLKGGGWYETDFKNANKRNLVASHDNGKDNGKEKEDSGKVDKPKNKPETPTTASQSASSSAAAS